MTHKPRGRRRNMPAALAADIHIASLHDLYAYQQDFRVVSFDDDDSFM